MSIAIKLEVFRNILTGIAEEMGARLQRSAYSSNIKERRDFSCALFDNKGRLAAQAAHIPVHLGSMPILIEKLLEDFSFEPNDTIIVNDPFMGGTHLPDITLVEPIFLGDLLWGFAATRAHHSDIGGMSAGSMPDSTRIYQEGIIIPPLFMRKKGIINEEILKLITHNTRTPKERMGDLFAQMSSLSVAIKRVNWMVGLYGFNESLHLIDELIKYSERMTKKGIRELPRATGVALDYLEDDRAIEDIPIKVKVEIKEDEIIVDFNGTAMQRDCNMNAPLPVTLASTYYVFRCILGDHIPANGGCFIPIKVKAPKGSIVNALAPFAVSAGNVETSQRIVDVILRALSGIIPKRVPAASNGSMNNVAIGGFLEGEKRNFAYYETIGGGCGAIYNKDGASGVHSHMTNTRNTPIEALETLYPFMVTKYKIRKGSGGEGVNSGGDGIIREYKFQVPCNVSIMSERRRNSPYGLKKGNSGKKGLNRYFNSELKKDIKLPGKVSLRVKRGDIITIETPGGGGWGEVNKGNF